MCCRRGIWHNGSPLLLTITCMLSVVVLVGKRCAHAGDIRNTCVSDADTMRHSLGSCLFLTIFFTTYSLVSFCLLQNRVCSFPSNCCRSKVSGVVCARAERVAVHLRVFVGLVSIVDIQCDDVF